MEANLLNKEALVKVEDDVIYFGADSIYTFPDQSIPSVKTIIQSGVNLSTNKSLNIVNNSKIEKNIGFTSISKVPNTYMSTKNSAPGSSYLGSHPMQPGKLFTVTNQAWQIHTYNQDNKRKAYVRLRLFNVVTEQGVKGYVAMHLYVTKANWLGKVRKINLDGIGIGGQAVVSLRGNSSDYSYDQPLTLVNNNGYIYGDPSLEEIETPIVVSNFFKMLGVLSTYGIDFSNYKGNYFYDCNNVIHDGISAQYDGYWKYFYTDRRIEHPVTNTITTPVWVDITSSGKGIFAGNSYSSGPINLVNDEDSWE